MLHNTAKIYYPCLVGLHTMYVRDHPNITSAKGLGGWGQKNGNFAYVQYYLCWHKMVGLVRKSPKMSWRNIRTVPKDNLYYWLLVINGQKCKRNFSFFSKQLPVYSSVNLVIEFLFWEGWFFFWEKLTSLIAPKTI